MIDHNESNKCTEARFCELWGLSTNNPMISAGTLVRLVTSKAPLAWKPRWGWKPTTLEIVQLPHLNKYTPASENKDSQSHENKAEEDQAPALSDKNIYSMIYC